MTRTSWQKTLDPNRVSGAVALYLPVAAILCFLGLGATGMVHMEGIVGDAARTMVESGDWIVPKVFGEIYTYKPGLCYWLSAVPHLFVDPPPMWLLRLPFAMSGFVMGLVVLLVISRVADPRLALFCSLASLSGGLFIQKVRLAEFDSALAAGVGVAVIAACANLAGKRPGLGLWVLAYLGLSFGFLAKGVPALMCFGPGLLLAALVTRRFPRLLDWRHLAGVLLFMILVGGYLVAVYRTAGADAFRQPLAESVLRALRWDQAQEGPTLSALEGVDTSVRPIETLKTTLSKPLHVLASFFPVSLLVPFAFMRARGEPRPETHQALLRAATSFLVAGVAAFMVVPAHENRYYLPMASAIGMIAGLVLVDAGALGPRARRWLLITIAAAACLTTLSMILLGVFSDTPPVSQLSRGLLLATGIPALALAILCLRQAGRDRTLILASLAVLGLLTSEVLAMQVRRASKRALRPQALALASFVPDDTPIWVLGPADLAGKSASLLYNLSRPIETFRPGVRLPPPNSSCLLASDRMHELEDVSGFVFHEVARESDPWRDYVLGMCSGPG